MQPFEEIRREVERFAEKLIQWGVPSSHEITSRLMQLELEIARFMIERDKKFLADVRAMGTAVIAEREGKSCSTIRRRRGRALQVAHKTA